MAGTAVTILVCALIADFLTGLIHWVEDTYGLPDWFLIGEPVIVPNIDHHRRPAAFTMGTWFSRNWQPVVGVLIVLCAAWLFGWAAWPVSLVIVLAGFGNEVHTWAHRKQNGPMVTFLQDAGLVQSKAQHAKHHRAPYDRYFCTLTNWVNPPLEAVRFWKLLEWALSKIGIRPKRCGPERDGL